jgi:diadenosine tetraphosphate (Ap4A) HIT family hydrolase
MGNIFRTKETVEKFEKCKKEISASENCPLCAKKAIKDFNLWKIVINDFPYDKIAEVHDMIIPKRHVTEFELTEEEKTEYLEIKKELLKEYDYIMEATNKTKSIPEHFHVHLIKTIK